MGYLERSTGPSLVPALPNQERARREFPEFEVEWSFPRPRHQIAAFWNRYPRSLASYFLYDATAEPENVWAPRYVRPFDELFDDPEFRERILSDPELLERVTSDLRFLSRRFAEPPAVSSVPEDDEQRELHRRSLYWTSVLLLLGHDLLSQALTRAPYPVEVSAGYLDPDDEVDAFGLAIAIGAADLDESFLPDEPTRLNSLPAIEQGQVNLPILTAWPEDGGPYVVRRDPAELRLHQPMGFGGASSASFVRDLTTAAPLGMLGCRHVLPNPVLGAGVPVTGYPAQKVERVQDDLDLAVVSSPVPVPTNFRQVQRWPAQWLPCTIDGNVSTVSTRIAQVSNQWGVFSDPRLPVHVDLEDPADHGDSGAAVIDAVTNGILGVYIGVIVNQGPTKARSVHIQQVETVMGLELVQ